jgi:hypothetical protein
LNHSQPLPENPHEVLRQRWGTEGYSLIVLRKAVPQAGKAQSFRDASEDFEKLLKIAICPSHLLKRPCHLPLTLVMGSCSVVRPELRKRLDQEC